MLFRENIDPRCAYCTKGTKLGDDEIGCTRYGIVPSWHHCRHFRYDPLKRVPPKPVRLKKSFAEIDFEL